MSVILETSIGDIEIDLYTDECPQECVNFLKLCKIKYYNFSLFHRILKNFIAQTGDPTAIGRGGESIWGKLKGNHFKYFPRRETNRIKHQRYGSLSMTNDGNDMHGSQFFITLGQDLDSLDGRHSVFGEVVEDSFEVLQQLSEWYCDDSGRPYQDVRIRHTIIIDDPFEDPPGLDRYIPEKSPEPTEEQLQTVRIADDEALNENEGMSLEEVEQLQKRKRAKAQATQLYMMGDIADAEAAPPENILFVCKLNPVTCAEDLEMIFARFGKVNSVEVIKDYKTGESLQYGFVEFDQTESAEEAYFKMDNALIDDRRIHVNFCQSIKKDNYHVPKRYGGNGQDKPQKADDKGSRESKRRRTDGRDDRPYQDRGRDGRGREHDREYYRRESDRERDRTRGRDDRDRDRTRNHESNRDRDRDRARDRDRNRDRNRDRDRDRDRGRDRDRERR